LFGSGAAATGIGVRDCGVVAAAGIFRLGPAQAANAGLRKFELHAPRGLVISGDVRGDRTHLFVARCHEESWRASVGFDTGDVQPRLRMGEFLRAMRAHRAAAMDVWVDERRKDRRTLLHYFRKSPLCDVKERFAPRLLCSQHQKGMRKNSNGA
jgi:hypothetical protein